MSAANSLDLRRGTLVLAVLCTLAGAACAQIGAQIGAQSGAQSGPRSGPSTQPPTEQTPNAETPPGGIARGVVPPPKGVDPGMITPPPANVQPSMPVIKPPGTSR